MNRCERCGRRWCTCIPAGASVDTFTAIPPGPRLGPDQPGRDANMEILEIAADIYWGLPPDQWLEHVRSLSTRYTPMQLAEALVIGMERFR